MKGRTIDNVQNCDSYNSGMLIENFHQTFSILSQSCMFKFELQKGQWFRFCAYSKLS
jgi:hypothetical protein